MRKLALALAAACAVLGAGCVGPTTTVRTVDTRPAIAVAGAPGGTTLFVDGVAVGRASDYDGNPNVLRVEPGTHEIEVRDGGGQPIFKQRVFVASELKPIQVH